MGRRLSNFSTQTLAASANNTVIPYNSARKYLYIGSTNSVGITIAFGNTISGGVAGFRIAAGQPGIEFRYEDVGDLVTQPVSVWNAGSAGASFAWVEAWDYADL